MGDTYGTHKELKNEYQILGVNGRAILKMIRREGECEVDPIGSEWCTTAEFCEHECYKFLDVAVYRLLRQLKESTRHEFFTEVCFIMPACFAIRFMYKVMSWITKEHELLLQKKYIIRGLGQF
jgi:hypothetical protein